MNKWISVAFIGFFAANPAHAAKLDAKAQYQDAQTKLIWQRCAVGQEYTANRCQGRAAQLTWFEAQKAVTEANRQAQGGKSNWRLPNTAELSSLRYCSKGWRTSGDGAVIRVPVPAGATTATVNFQCNWGYQRPTINKATFPNAPTGDFAFFWSADTKNQDPYFAYGVDFNLGLSSYYYKYLRYSVRLVRNP